MNKKTQFSNLTEIVITVTIFVLLAYFIFMLFGILPSPAEIFKSIIRLP